MHRFSLIAITAVAILLGTGLISSATAQEAPDNQAPQGKHGSDDVLYGNNKIAAKLVHKDWDAKDPRPTCKVFHHVFAPDGTLLTKGLGGKFGHHRGLFLGWNQTKKKDKTYDFWHLNKGESQRFRGLSLTHAIGIDEAGQVSLIDWCDPQGKIVIRELRGLHVVDYSDDHYTLLMRSKCSTLIDDIILTGDPQHAGQQFRALQRFAEEDQNRVTYLRPEGAKDHGNDVWTQCNWIAAILKLDDASYTVLRVEAADNPGETKWSTRDYGRFGATRTVTVKKAHPLVLNQYYVVANGAHDAAWCQQHAAKLRQPTAESSAKDSSAKESSAKDSSAKGLSTKNTSTKSVTKKAAKGGHAKQANKN